MLLDPMWRLLVWVKDGMNSARIGRNGLNFAVRV